MKRRSPFPALELQIETTSARSSWKEIKKRERFGSSVVETQRQVRAVRNQSTKTTMPRKRRKGGLQTKCKAGVIGISDQHTVKPSRRANIRKADRGHLRRGESPMTRGRGRDGESDRQKRGEKGENDEKKGCLTVEGG